LRRSEFDGSILPATNTKTTGHISI